MATSSLPFTTTSLHLNHDEDAPEDDLRRILPIGNQWVAYGGETGALFHGTQEIRHWDDDDDLRAVAVHENLLAVGLESGSVIVYTMNKVLHEHPTNITVGPIFEASVRDLLFISPHQLAIATEAGLCIWNMDTNERFLDDTPHHKDSGVRSLALSPDRTLLASLAMDGVWCTWKLVALLADSSTPTLLHRGDRCVTKNDVGEALGADPWDRACRPVWAADNATLLLPGEPWIQVRDLAGKVCDDDVTTPGVGTIVACAVRRDGVVSVARDGKVVLWRRTGGGGTKLFQMVKEIVQLESAATDVVWSAEDGTLRLACANGSLVTVPDVALPETAAAAAPKELTTEAAPVNVSKEKQKKDDTVSLLTKKKPSNDDEDEGSDDDMFNTGTQSNAEPSRFIDDEADDDDDDDSLSPDNSNRVPEDHNGTAAPHGTNDNGGDDDGNHFGDMADTHHHDDDDDDDISIPDHPLAATAHHQYNPQDAFAPSATPLDLDRRFLCWNHVGSIVRRQDTLSSVDIQFTDAGFRRPISITDTMGFLLGSLGEDGALLCTDVAVDEEKDANDDDAAGFSESVRAAMRKKSVAPGSTVYFHRFQTFSSLRDKDWSIALPSGELALGCATGDGWAAVMTSRRFLRVFTTGGNQGNIYWLEGDPVTMAGRGQFLACVYHTGEPLRDGSQQMGCMVLDVLANKMVSKGRLSCLSSASSLTWIGFSNDSSLLAMDSTGMMSMLVNMGGSNWEWMPMLDTCGLRKSSDDSFWPVSVFDGKLICVPLKGGNKHPDALRKPITTTLGLRIPLARGLIAKTVALEEVSLRATVALGQKRAIDAIGEETIMDDDEHRLLSAQVDKVTLRMFNATIEAGKLERALDLIRRLNTEKSFELAMRMAGNSNTKLIDAIERIMTSRFAGLDDEEDEYEQPAITSRKRPHQELPSRNVRRITATPPRND